MPLHRALSRALLTSLALAGAVLATAGTALADLPADVGTGTVTVTPATAVEPVGNSHTVTATVRDAAGDPDSGRLVDFFVNGSPGPGASGCISLEPDGQCSYTYQGPALPRTDVVTACADLDADGTVDPDEPCGSATVTWVAPAGTAGHATGAGQAPNASGTGALTFAFDATSDRRGARGACLLVDPAARTIVTCWDVTTLVRSGGRATFFGHATVNGTPTTYRIDVEDNGAGRTDVFRVETASGYAAGGVVERGDIQVR